MKIFVSEKGYRPIEHLYGLIVMSLSDSSNEYFFDVTENKTIPIFLKKELKNTIDLNKGFIETIVKLFYSDVYVGNPGGWKKFIIRIRCALFRKITITIRPGKVTKASGYFSKGNISLITILKAIFQIEFS